MDSLYCLWVWAVHTRVTLVGEILKSRLMYSYIKRSSETQEMRCSCKTNDPRYRVQI